MHAEAVRHIEFPGAVRRERHAGRVAAVIGVAQRDHVVVAGVSPRHEQREIVRLRAGVDEVANLQIARHFRRELLGDTRDVRVQINRRRVLEQFRSACCAAATTCGWQWPTLTVTMPPRPSR